MTNIAVSCLVHFSLASRIFPIFSNCHNCTCSPRYRVKSHLFKEYSRKDQALTDLTFFLKTHRHLRDYITNLIINPSVLILNSFMLDIFFPSAGIWDFWRLESCFIFIYNSQWVAKYWVINAKDCLMFKFIVAAFKLLGTFLMLLILSEPYGFPLGNFKSQPCSAISRTRVSSSDAYPAGPCRFLRGESWE